MENKTILIVEDETIIAMDIKAKLEDLNYVVAEIVSTGEDAVKKLQKSGQISFLQILCSKERLTE